jgi:sporulation protein YlmC with PRC-barrel domain
MAGTEQFTIGAEVSCTDGPCGKVARVVVDPVARAVTHLVVEPHHEMTEARLVPLDLVDATAAGIQLRSTLAEFAVLNPAQNEQFLQGSIDYPGYGPEQAVFWPYYGYRGGRGDVATTDNVPLGEVEVDRGEPVHATDGDIGRVEGLVIDPASHHVTHVLLQEGHLWGRKDVAIPISAVTKLDDRIQLSLTKRQVEDLPAVDVERPAG